MLAYAANRPVAGKRPSSPPAMLVIISVHVALIALVMSAKMESHRRPHDPTTVVNVPIDRPPPPSNTTSHTPQHAATPLPISDPIPNVPLPHPNPVRLDPGAAADPGVAIGGGGASSIPQIPILAPIRHDPRLLTPPDELKPPYPDSKILSEEEATLHLRLTISASGRVVAVEPVGPADRVFLDAARKYLIAHWRYSPATEDGHAIASSLVISLHFELNG